MNKIRPFPDWVLQQVPGVNTDFDKIREAIAQGTDYIPPITAILAEHGRKSSYIDLDTNEQVKTVGAIVLFVRAGHPILEEWHCEPYDTPFDFDWQVDIYHPDAESKYHWQLNHEINTNYLD